MLITSTEIKKILNISDSNYDNAINQIIIFFTDWLVDYTNNKFVNENLYLTSSGISFSVSDILDSESGFVDAGFTAGMDIYISGSYHNDGHYTIDPDGITAGQMSVVNKTFTSENLGALTTIYQVQYPVGLKLASANIIGYLLNQGRTAGISSESIGDYSVQYTANLPDSLKQLLKAYRKVKWL